MRKLDSQNGIYGMASCGAAEPLEAVKQLVQKISTFWIDSVSE
jgi:hypothetical protein